MRPSAIALISVVAALLGGTAAVVVGKAGGWLGSTTTATFVVTEPRAESAVAVRTVSAPAGARGFAPARIYRQRAGGVVTVFSFFGAAGTASASQGSGFVVSKDGVVLTNAHVVTNAGEAATPSAIQPAREVYVEFSDGDRVPAEVIGWDVFDDVGALRVDPKQHVLQPVPLGTSATVVVGEPVAAIGSPFGNADSLSVGVVSATRSIASLTSRYQIVDAIQTDAPINHGNSGGPLFDAAGRVIGVNAQIRSGSHGTGGFEGVGFAIPIDAAKRSLRELLATGSVAYAYVGIGTEDLTPSLARRYGYGVLRGALVDKVEPGTAAARAGLRAGTRTVRFAGEQVRLGGDVIVAIDGRAVDGAGDVVRIVSDELVPGRVARFTIVRDGERLDLPVRLDTRPLR